MDCWRRDVAQSHAYQEEAGLPAYEHIGATRRCRQTRKYKEYKCGSAGKEYDRNPANQFRCLQVCAPQKTRQRNRRCVLDSRLQTPERIQSALFDKTRHHFSKSLETLAKAVTLRKRALVTREQKRRALMAYGQKSRRDAAKRAEDEQRRREADALAATPLLKDVNCIEPFSAAYDHIKAPLPQRRVAEIIKEFNRPESDSHIVSNFNVKSQNRMGYLNCQIDLITLCSLDPNGSVSRFPWPGDPRRKSIAKQLNTSAVEFFMTLVRASAPAHFKVGHIVTFQSDDNLEQAAEIMFKKVNFTAYHRLFYIINPGGHYYLVVIDLPARTVFVLDSLHPSDSKRYPDIQKYVIGYLNEVPALNGAGEAKFRLQSVGGIPEQPDATSCGMYACMFLVYLVFGLCLKVKEGKHVRPAFDDASNADFRYKMADSLLQGKLAFHI